MSPELLHNIVWHALSGPQASFAQGPAHARRYAAGVTDLIGFQSLEQPDLAALAPFCRPGERFYCLGWTGLVPEGWKVDLEAGIVKMLWEAPAPPEQPNFQPVQLGPEHSVQALELAELTHPGPFGLRTMELGEFFGCFHGEKLIAMAGERMTAGKLREVSAVCTHPEHQGQGLARRLMHHLMRRQILRGEQPFLHVMSENARARQLYQRMGFREYSETVCRVLSKSPAST